MQVSEDACLTPQLCDRWVRQEKHVLGVLGRADIFRRTRLLGMAAALDPRPTRCARLIPWPLGAGFVATAMNDQRSWPTARLWDIASLDAKHTVRARKRAENEKPLFFYSVGAYKKKGQSRGWADSSVGTTAVNTGRACQGARAHKRGDPFPEHPLSLRP